jgi:hypothetical protein
VIFLILAGVFALAKDPDKGYIFCILAIIAGGFSLLYGVFWFIYGRVERKSEKKLREILEVQNTTEDPNRLDYQEFILPKAALIKKAGKRAHDIVRWTGIAALGVFLIIGGIQVACGSLKSPVQLLYMLLFCMLIMVPGLLVHLNLYLKYNQSVPTRILLFPGKLVIDNIDLSAGEIQKISVSPGQIFNPNSTDVFREMLIQTEKSSTKYRIDYRTGTFSNEQPFWAEYEQFVAALAEWGKKNRVQVVVSYMA